jgi:hypothetical protein
MSDYDPWGSSEIDWSADDTGWSPDYQAELDAYTGGGGYSSTGEGYEELQPWQNVSTTGDTTSGNMFGGLGASDIAKFFASSPALSGIAKTLGTIGAGKLADKLFNVQGGPGGYKGGIPTLTASRQMLPIPTTMKNAAGEVVARRPGSGGISYFSPMQYAPPGAAATPPTPPTAATPPAKTPDAPPKTLAEEFPYGDISIAHGYASGGIANLGSYSDGGRLLKGPGDGVSDSIPATIGKGQPARLADGEFVIPARIVSELGNGSTEAGARKLYAMMDRIKKSRRKAKNIAADTKSDKHLPA